MILVRLLRAPYIGIEKKKRKKINVMVKEEKLIELRSSVQVR